MLALVEEAWLVAPVARRLATAAKVSSSEAADGSRAAASTDPSKTNISKTNPAEEKKKSSPWPEVGGRSSGQRDSASPGS